MGMQNLTIYGPAEVAPLVYGEEKADWNGKRMVHFGLHNSANRNAGDTLLFAVVRRTFDVAFGPFQWNLRQLWQELSVQDVHDMNDQFDGIVLGGGGLLLRDQAGADVSNSGWQWNSTVDAVSQIRIPFSVFAIGYNRFRGQEDFDPIFTEHLNQTVRSASFFGLRNKGSIEAVKGYLAEDLRDKPIHQGCPTTVLWQLYPDVRSKIEQRERPSRPRLALNAAFDRAELRFGSDRVDQLKSVARVAKAAEKRGWEIIQTSHKTMDRGLEAALDAEDVEYSTVDITEASPAEIMDFYAGIDLAVGMRGHAQMIPFGLRRPIISLISHNKMRYFLDDIDRNEWGVEMSDPDFEEKLDHLIRTVEEAPEAVGNSLARAQEEVWAQTHRNLSYIGEHVLHMAMQV